MMRPPRGSCAFIIRNASWVHRNAPVRLTSTTACHCSSVRSSSGRAGRADAGVVEQHVEAPERRAGRREQRAHRSRVGHVGGDRQRLPAADHGLVDRLLQRRRPATRERDAVAVAQQRQRGRLADAGAGAGDQRDLGSGTHRLPFARSGSGGRAPGAAVRRAAASSRCALSAARAIGCKRPPATPSSSGGRTAGSAGRGASRRSTPAPRSRRRRRSARRCRSRGTPPARPGVRRDTGCA